MAKKSKGKAPAKIPRKKSAPNGGALSLPSTTEQPEQEPATTLAVQGSDQHKANMVCEYIIEGQSVRVASKNADLEVTKFMRMLAADQNGPLVKQYLRAREARADMRFERIDELKDMLIAGVIDAQTANVLINTEFRQMGKENAKRYGDKIDLTSDGKQIAVPVVTFQSNPE